MDQPGLATAATRLCGISHPVFQAGMAGIAGPELAAAVSEAGGLGHLGALRLAPAALERQITETRGLTNRPFGINLVHRGGPAMFEHLLAVAIKAKPCAISLFYGDFAQVIPRIRAAGIVTMVQVGSVAEARKAVADGADMLIAQGIEAGGHLRGRIGLMALVPAVVDVAGRRPVLAAGAIADGRALRAALALGAAGVWCGTLFAAARESNAHSAYRQRLVAADTDTPRYRRGLSYGWPWGTPHRAIPGRGGLNPWRLMGGGLRRGDKGALADRLSLYAGQGVGQIRDSLPAAEIVARLVAGQRPGSESQPSPQGQDA
ncbi:MAG TPA: nitronate monooxygenase [Aliiroseovarius sp.]|nr:nitronate monooxygenase [Aliiroseovarius sp.]